MPGDRTLPPSPRRQWRAWVGGLRTRSRWLVVGVGCLILGAAIDHGAWIAESWGLAFRALVAGESALQSLLGPLLVLAAGLAVLGSLALVVAGISLAGLGPTHRVELERLRPVQIRSPLIGAAALALLGLALLGNAFLPAAAGAARAVDASPNALVELWQIWLVRGLTITGLALGLLGLGEAWLSRRSLWHGLHQTPEQARDERRRARSGRG